MELRTETVGLAPNGYQKRKNFLIEYEYNFNFDNTILHDGRTSVALITDATGAVTTRFRYDPFGNMTSGRPTNGFIFGFNGEKYMVATGYQFLRARFYDKSTGRFLTRDTFLGWEDMPLSLNRYSYVHNDLVNFVDPTGLSAQSLEDEIRAERHAAYYGSPWLSTRERQRLADEAEARVRAAHAARIAAEEARRREEERLRPYVPYQTYDPPSYTWTPDNSGYNPPVNGAPPTWGGNYPGQDGPWNSGWNNQPTLPDGPGSDGSNNHLHPDSPNSGRPDAGGTTAGNGAGNVCAITPDVCQPHQIITILDEEVRIPQSLYDYFMGRNGTRPTRNSRRIGELVRILVTQVPFNFMNVSKGVQQVSDRFRMSSEVWVEFSNQLTDAVASESSPQDGSFTNRPFNFFNGSYTIMIKGPALPSFYQSFTISMTVAIANTLFYSGRYEFDTIVNDIIRSFSFSVGSDGSLGVGMSQSVDRIRKSVSAGVGSLTNSIGIQINEQVSTSAGAKICFICMKLVAYLSATQRPFTGFSVTYKAGRYVTADDFDIDLQIPLELLVVSLTVLTMAQMLDVINSGRLAGARIPVWSSVPATSWSLLGNLLGVELPHPSEVSWEVHMDGLRHIWETAPQYIIMLGVLGLAIIAALNGNWEPLWRTLPNVLRPL